VLNRRGRWFACKGKRIPLARKSLQIQDPIDGKHPANTFAGGLVVEVRGREES